MRDRSALLPELTRGARGCGRQATYVEVCDGAKTGAESGDTKCTWVMDTTNRGGPVPTTP